MKRLTNLTASKWLLSLSLVLFTITSCQKDISSPSTQEEIATTINKDHGHLKQTKTFSSEVVLKWMDMQLRLFRTNATPIGGLPPQRFFAYSAIAAYESVVPGMPSYQSLSGQLTDMPDMPQTLAGYAYHWASSANASLAAMTRNFFPNTSNANKASMDSLENALNNVFQSEINTDEFQRSILFGKSIAQLIFDWSKSDGAANANAPYTPPVGQGLWVPTPPAFATPFGPYWENNRLMVQGSLSGSNPIAPPAYSINPSSEYYNMVKEVFDISQTLTAEQIAIAVYYRDAPGFGGGHYLSILRQVLAQTQSKLDVTALAFAKTGIAIVDAGIGCWKAKYNYNLERPITYIRSVLGHTTWNPLLVTPPFPEYPSGHSTIGGAMAEILTSLFGDNFQFTNHTYDYLGMGPRTYSSFYQMAEEIGDSRVYGGIHYSIACTEGNKQGRKIASNVLNILKFKK